MRHRSWPALVPGVFGVVCSAWPVKDSSLLRYEEPPNLRRPSVLDQPARSYVDAADLRDG